MNIPLILGLIAKLTTEVGWVGLWVAGGETGDQALHHAHRVRFGQLLLLVSFEEVEQLGIDLVVHSDFRFEAHELLSRGQLSINQQESSLSEPGFSGELINWEASILQDTLITVDI